MHEDIRNFQNGQYKYWITCSRYIRSDRRILRKYCNSMCKYLNLWSLHWLRSDTFKRWFVYFIIFQRFSINTSFSYFFFNGPMVFYILYTFWAEFMVFRTGNKQASRSGRVSLLQHKLVSEGTERGGQRFISRIS